MTFTTYLTRDGEDLRVEVEYRPAIKLESVTKDGKEIELSEEETKFIEEKCWSDWDL